MKLVIESTESEETINAADFSANALFGTNGQSKFLVTEATSLELETIGLINSSPPENAVIVTEDGFSFVVQKNGDITDGDITFKSMAEFTVRFTLYAWLNGNPVQRMANTILDEAAKMTTDELDEWYLTHVGYRLSEDDPTIIGSSRHSTSVAEMMCLHRCGEGAIHTEMQNIIAKQVGHRNASQELVSTSLLTNLYQKLIRDYPDTNWDDNTKEILQEIAVHLGQ